ncbi:hypothetical protein D3C79_782340 [compost metagenome]
MAVVQQATVDLVAHQPKIMVATKLRELHHVLRGDGAAGRIVRCVQQQPTGTRGYCARHGLRVEPKALLRA